MLAIILSLAAANGCRPDAESIPATRKEVQDIREVITSLTQALSTMDRQNAAMVTNIWTVIGAVRGEVQRSLTEMQTENRDGYSNTWRIVESGSEHFDKSLTKAMDIAKELQDQINRLTNSISVREWYTEEPGKQTSVGLAKGKRHEIWVVGYWDSSNRWNSVIAYNKQAYTNLDNQLNGK